VFFSRILLLQAKTSLDGAQNIIGTILRMSQRKKREITMQNSARLRAQFFRGRTGD